MFCKTECLMYRLYFNWKEKNKNSLKSLQRERIIVINTVSKMSHNMKCCNKLNLRSNKHYKIR